MTSQAPKNARPSSPPKPGIVVVDKPAGMTSHDVVAKMRRFFGTRKIGHAGTLDPMATGVLVLGVERATKLLGHLALDRKTYVTTIALGTSTTTDDAEGEPLGQADTTALDRITDTAITTEIANLTGDIQQVPSAVSAIKIDGKRSYARVRAGENVQLPARPVTVYRFDPVAFRRENGGLEIDAVVECSSGTYIRALARDLGASLEVGGHLSALRRTTVGPFSLAAARTLDQLAEAPTLSYDLNAAVSLAFPRHDVTAAEAKSIQYGQPIPAANITGTYGIFDPQGHALTLAQDHNTVAKSVVVLAPA